MIAQQHGTGIPLIAVHGFGVDHRIMLPLEEMISGTHADSGQAWRRVYLDLPWAEGAAASEARTPKEVADAVLAQVREITAGGPFAIIGNSFGAMVARHIAHELNEQCAGLATLAGAFELDREKRELPPKEIVIHDDKILSLAGDDRADFEEMAVLHTKAALTGFTRFVLPGIRGTKLRVLARLNQTYTDAYEPEKLATAPFTAPSLHVFGRQDHVVGYADGLAVADHYPRGTFAVIDGAGHNVHIEAPDAVGTLVRDWLASAARHAKRRS